MLKTFVFILESVVFFEKMRFNVEMEPTKKDFQPKEPVFTKLSGIYYNYACKIKERTSKKLSSALYDFVVQKLQ